MESPRFYSLHSVVQFLVTHFMTLFIVKQLDGGPSLTQSKNNNKVTHIVHYLKRERERAKAKQINSFFPVCLTRFVEPTFREGESTIDTHLDMMIPTFGLDKQ